MAKAVQGVVWRRIEGSRGTVIKRTPDFGRAYRELFFLKAAQGNLTHVVRLYRAFYDGGLYCIEMESILATQRNFCPTTIGDLLHYMKSLLKVCYTNEALSDLHKALAYLHSLGIVHGDIKPSNALLDQRTNEVRLIDFGTSVWSSYRGGTALLISDW